MMNENNNNGRDLQEISYRKMDNLVACITPTHLLMKIKGTPGKSCAIEKNQTHLEILEGCPPITKEEFEDCLEVNDPIFTIMYQAYIK